MAIDLAFRRAAVRGLTTAIGCYVLCDLDRTPIYVGKSRDSIRARVNRHLTSARSDIIANRQIDVWEIAWVQTYAVERLADIAELENALFHAFHGTSALMNGKPLPLPVTDAPPLPEPGQTIQVMSDEEIREKRDPALRLPRQAEHYSQIVGHFIAVKNSKEIAGAMDAHFQRLQRYHRRLLGVAEDVKGDDPDEGRDSRSASSTNTLSTKKKSRPVEGGLKGSQQEASNRAEDPLASRTLDMFS